MLPVLLRVLGITGGGSALDFGGAGKSSFWEVLLGGSVPLFCMSSRNPKRSSRLAAKDAAGESRKKVRGAADSPDEEDSPVAAPRTVHHSPAKRGAGDGAAAQRDRRGQTYVGSGAADHHLSGGRVTDVQGYGDGGSVSRAQHPAGVSAAQAASARKEASFNTQLLQQQQQHQSRPSGGSHSAKRDGQPMQPQQAYAGHPMQYQQQRMMMQQQQQQQLMQQQQHRLGIPMHQHMNSPNAQHAMAARQQFAQHPMQGGVTQGYVSVNGRGHPEGIAGNSMRSRGDIGGQMMGDHAGHLQHGFVDPRELGGHGHLVHQNVQQQALTEDLRKGLGGAVERWISARNMLPGEDSARFPSEIHRLVGLIAFEACERSRGEEEQVDEQGEGSGEGVCRTETTVTRFRLAHPEVKGPFIFEATNHFFSGTIVGAETCIEQLRWKVDFELVGYLILALHTQSYESEFLLELILPCCRQKHCDCTSMRRAFTRLCILSCSI